MFPRYVQFLFGLVIACVISLATKGNAQEVRERSKERTSYSAASDNVHELYVAIMGEVDTPGTYRMSSSSLKMHRVIQCARGFTANASSSIKIIRGGRLRQTEIFSETVDSPLMPGDLLIVEPKRPLKPVGKIADSTILDTQTIRANYEEGTIRSGVQIALVNVLDYPVVLRLRPDQANASYLVQALGQPSALLTKTRVITPDVPRRQSSDDAKRASRMEDGSVVVFEYGKVNRNRLPVTLPMPLDTDLQLGSHDRLIGFRYRNAQELRNLGQHPFWSSSDPFDTGPRVALTARPLSSEPQEPVPEILQEEDSTAELADSQPSDATMDLLEQTTPSGVELPLEAESPTATIPSEIESGVSTSLQIFILVLVGASILVAAGWFNSLEKKSAESMAEVAAAEGINKPVTESRSLISGLIAQSSIPEGNDVMTIPIRQSDSGSIRRSPADSKDSPEQSHESAASSDSHTTPTPLARALRQLEKRRSA